MAFPSMSRLPTKRLPPNGRPPNPQDDFLTPRGRAEAECRASSLKVKRYLLASVRLSCAPENPYTMSCAVGRTPFKRSAELKLELKVLKAESAESAWPTHCRHPDTLPTPRHTDSGHRTLRRGVRGEIPNVGRDCRLRYIKLYVRGRDRAPSGAVTRQPTVTCERSDSGTALSALGGSGRARQMCVCAQSQSTCQTGIGIDLTCKLP